MTQIDPSKPVQVAIVVRDLSAKIEAWRTLLGLEPSKALTTGTVDQTGTRYHGELTGARCRVALFEVGGCEIELLEPIEGPSVWSDQLERHGESVHHIGFLVDDMDVAVASVGDAGMPVVQAASYESEFDTGRYAYFDSQRELGVMLEFNQVS